jgi:hypothetical protein
VTLVDLLHQVQKRLPVRFGGTGNPHGWATDSVVGAYVNGTGSTITRGTVVELANYLTMGGGNIADSRIKPTSAAAQLNALGVVVGRFRTDAPNNEWEDADCEDGDVCSVVISGKALVNVEGTVAVGQYAYTAATDGMASGADDLVQGGIGTWESAGSGQAQVRLWGSPTTPGVMGSLLLVFGDGLTLIQPGTLIDVPVPFKLLFLDWTLVSTQAGSISIDIYKGTYANFPPTGVDSMTYNEPPMITSGLKNQATLVYGVDPLFSPTGWSQDITYGDILRFIVESASAVSQVSLLLRYVRR